MGFFLGCSAIALGQSGKKETACTGACCRPADNSQQPAAATKMAPEKSHWKGTMACRLTTPELQKRKASVIASLKKKITQRKELPEGFAYLFAATDNTIDELTAFIKTERLCCDFFDFSLSFEGDALWLTITGGPGVKAFITEEIGL
ncbi:hypothetical protein [Taibaiella koreensis]|uniref:hypothetical protein n=1 Tax=Taibaiella koreensis TaxID=1268548 RepID=UPI0013C31283|nr:hypothetical protein [Taibaiella koreensis]